MTREDAEPPRLLVDPTTARPILMAPLRQKRPMHTGPAASRVRCPFCQGNEADTPAEVDAERDGRSQRDAAGWVGRAFANKYPANDHHEVIAEGMTHFDQPADLDRATLRRCLCLWQRRVRAMESRPEIACAYLFKNVGALAGASIAHNHTQVLGLTELPPRLQLEADQARRSGRCPWCTSLATAQAEGRVVFDAEHHVVLVPEPPKLPYETWLLPRACDDDFLATDLDSLAAAMQAMFTAVQRGLGQPAFNLWQHRIPGRRFHWHFELQPRTGQMAGLELGADMYINSVTARVAAAKLRAGLATATGS